MNADRMTSGVAVIGLILATVLSASPLTAQTKPNATQITIVALGASNTEGQGRTRGLSGKARSTFLAKARTQVKNDDLKRHHGSHVGAARLVGARRCQAVILQPGLNDLGYVGGFEKRKANIEEITKRLLARGVITIRVDKIVDLDALPNQYFQDDGFHWNAEGHALIANQLLQPVMDALGAPAR